MNNPSNWRANIAQSLAQHYAQNPQVVTVMLGGSASRGYADKFSDIDLGVFWHQPPTLSDRRAVIQAVHADELRLYAYDANEQVWSDDYTVGRNTADAPLSGCLVEVGHYLASFVDSTLHNVIDDHSTNLLAHNLIAGIVDGIPLHNPAQITAWQHYAAQYPDGLAVALIETYGVIDHFWRWEMYIERRNRMMLYHAFSDVQQRILQILLALNKIYYFGFKWLAVVSERLTIKPDNLHQRIQSTYGTSPQEAAQTIMQLVDDTFTLVEQHQPDVNTERLRRIFSYQRPFWETSPLDDDR